MLGQRRRRWANILPRLGLCLVFAGVDTESCDMHSQQIRDPDPMLGQRRDGAPTASRH